MTPIWDDPLGPVIRETLQASRTDCPDAGTIAAYAERALTSSERRGVEQHLSNCSRCRETLLLMDRAETGTATENGTVTVFQKAKKRGSPLYRWPWLAAAAAAGLATVIWLKLPPSDVRAPEVAQFATRDQPPSGVAEAPKPSEQADANQATAEADSAEVVPPVPPSGAPVAGVAAPPSHAERRAFGERQKPLDALRDERKLEEAEQRRARADKTPPASEAPVPAAPSTREPAPQRESIATDATALMARQNREYMIAAGPKARAEVAGAAPAITWRVWTSGVVERSANGGATWTREAGVDALGARAVVSPTADVCWIVGDNGLILRFETGRGWTRVTPPAQIGFVAIEASDVRNATITAADTRRFTTTDGGQTWK
jgi:Putative zinc-finger